MPSEHAGDGGREKLARSREYVTWNFLCERLQRDPATSDETDTCSLRAAWKAMLAFSARERTASAEYEAGMRAGVEAAAKLVDETIEIDGHLYEDVEGWAIGELRLVASRIRNLPITPAPDKPDFNAMSLAAGIGGFALPPTPAPDHLADAGEAAFRAGFGVGVEWASSSGVTEQWEVESAAWRRYSAAAAAALAEPSPDGERVEAAWQELLDKDDRNSPADYPDMALITRDELAGYMQHGVSSSEDHWNSTVEG